MDNNIDNNSNVENSTDMVNSVLGNSVGDNSNVEKTVDNPVNNFENTTNMVVTDDPKKKKKGNKPIIIILVLLVLGMGGYITYDKVLKDKFFNKDTETKTDKKDSEKDTSNKENSQNKKEDKKKIGYGDPESLDGRNNKLKIYKFVGDGYEYYCKDYDKSCKDEGFFINVYSNKAKILDIYDYQYFERNNRKEHDGKPKVLVLYEDNDAIYFYDNLTGNSYKTKLETGHDKYTIVQSEYVMTGIVYADNEDKNNSDSYKNTGYYRLSNSKKYLDNKYNAISGTVLENLVVGTKYTDDDEIYAKASLVNLDTGKVEITVDDMDLYVNKYDDDYLIFETSYSGYGPSTIYSSDAKMIVDELDEQYYSITDKKEIYVYDENSNVINKYNFEGNKVEEIDIDEEVMHILDDYVLIVKNGQMYFNKIDGSETNKLGEYKDEYYYHWMLSGYYNAGALENENEKEAGYYFIVGYSGEGDQDEENNPGVEYYFNPKTKKVKRYELPYIGGYAKPVLYLYPTKDTNVTVNFEHEDSLTTTYPKFVDSWEVLAKPNGDLYDKNGKYYYGLYWEEKKNHEVDFKEGFYVEKKDAINFLEEKLAIIGLNDREANEFIMYWLPILEKNEKSLVYFELTEERDSYNKIDISPKPDSMLRMAIHVKPVNKKVNIKEQKLQKFERKGFTAIEWGGVQYK